MTLFIHQFTHCDQYRGMFATTHDGKQVFCSTTGDYEADKANCTRYAAEEGYGDVKEITEEECERARKMFADRARFDRIQDAILLTNIDTLTPHPYNTSMKTLNCLLVLAFAFGLTSCSTDPGSGEKLLLGKSGKEWLVFGIGFGKEAAPIAEKHWEGTVTK